MHSHCDWDQSACLSMSMDRNTGCRNSYVSQRRARRRNGQRAHATANDLRSGRRGARLTSTRLTTQRVDGAGLHSLC